MHSQLARFLLFCNSDLFLVVGKDVVDELSTTMVCCEFSGVLKVNGVCLFQHRKSSYNTMCEKNEKRLLFSPLHFLPFSSLPFTLLDITHS